jgi:hypothetical protein
MRKALIALALAAAFLASPSSFEPLWTLLASADAGCIFDPYGGCTPAPPPQTDNGYIVDPLG